MRSDFSLDCRATEGEVRRCVTSIIAELKSVGLVNERLGDIELALAEAINNIVEHAYRDQPDGIVKARVMVETDHLIVRLRDTGAPMPSGQIPAARLAQLGGEIEDLPEGGFGWFLIHSLTSAVRYDREIGGNRLSLFFELRETDVQPQ